MARSVLPISIAVVAAAAMLTGCGSILGTPDSPSDGEKTVRPGHDEADSWVADAAPLREDPVPTPNIVGGSPVIHKARSLPTVVGDESYLLELADGRSEPGDVVVRQGRFVINISLLRPVARRTDTSRDLQNTIWLAQQVAAALAKQQ